MIVLLVVAVELLVVLVVFDVDVEAVTIPEVGVIVEVVTVVVVARGSGPVR